MTRILIRSFLYLVFAAVLAQVLYLEAQNLPTEQLFSERGYTEILQAAMLLAGALVLGWKSRAGALSQLALCLAMGFAFLFIRENAKGPHFERWRHMHGCGRFFNAVRDTVSDKFLTTYEAGAPRPDLSTLAEGQS